MRIENSAKNFFLTKLYLHLKKHHTLDKPNFSITILNTSKICYNSGTLSKDKIGSL
jgi:hypothetical protein